MNFLRKLTANSFLMMVLFAMLFLPIGAMGFAGVNKDSQVLSAQDEKTETPADAAVNANDNNAAVQKEPRQLYPFELIDPTVFQTTGTFVEGPLESTESINQ